MKIRNRAYYVCDFCGSETTGEDFIKIPAKEYWRPSRKRYDVCEKCMDQMRAFIAERRKDEES